jgi:MFS family permease
MPVESLARRFGVHPDVIRLGVVSFLTDLSSEMIFSVFAVYFTTIAGASAALLGLVEGAADFAASSLDYLSGWWADRSGDRKSLAVLGYGFSMLAKALLLLARTVAAIAAFRVVERLGKSIRGAPRDAWLAAVAGRERRGYAFGIHKALDRGGAFLGPLVAYALVASLGDRATTYRTLFWVALLPAVLGVVVLCLVRAEPAVPRPREDLGRNLAALNPELRRFLVAAGIFSLGYFSYGFLLVRAHGVGFAVKDVVLLYALISAVVVLVAPLVGRLGDRVGRARIVLAGYLTYGVVCAGFAFASSKAAIVALFALYGVFCAIDESQNKAFIADLEPERRASAIGAYNFLTGLLYLPASLVAGALWAADPAHAFLVAAGFAGVAALVFLALRPGRVRDA